VSQQVMAAHQDAALLALILLEITGLVAWIALWRFRRWHEAGVLVLAIVTFGLMARAANIGGHIRHPEILAEGTSAPVPGWPRTAAAGAALVLDNPWVWPIIAAGSICLWIGVIFLGRLLPISEANSSMLVPFKQRRRPHVTP